jgi:O-antigen/teichoic acid export membrane protein
MSGIVVARLLSYGGVTAFSHASSFFMLAIYARWLSPSDYGGYSLVTPLILLAAPTLTFGMLPSFFRFYRKAPGDVPATAFAFVATVILALMTMALLLHERLSRYAFDASISTQLIGLVLVAMSLETCLQLQVTHLRAEERSGRYAVVMGGKAVVTLGAGLVLVPGLEMGLLGAISALVAGSLSGAVLAYALRPMNLGHVSMPLLREMLIYGLPIMPTNLLKWGLSYADRFLLIQIVTVAALAPYSAIVALVAGLNGLPIAAFSLLWPPVMFRIAERERAREIFGEVATAFFAVLLGINLALILFAQPALSAFAPRYTDASDLIPLIVLGQVLYFPFVFVTTALLVADATSWILFSVLVGTLVNVGVNLMLIPTLGITGAALGLVAGNVALTGTSWISGQRIYRIQYQWGKLAWLVMVAAVAAMLHLMFSSLSLASSLLCIYGALACCLVTPIRDYLCHKARQVIGREGGRSSNDLDRTSNRWGKYHGQEHTDD